MVMTVEARLRDDLKSQAMKPIVETLRKTTRHEVEYTQVIASGGELLREFKIRFDEIKRSEMTPNELYNLITRMKRKFSTEGLKILTVYVRDI